MTRQGARKARRILRMRERGKAFFAKSDELMDELIKKHGAGAEIRLEQGKKVVIVDNFAEKNKVFRAHGIARYELKVENTL